MKIVSLLPSATEIVYALGLGAHLYGVSFECDYPEAARSVPVVSGTVLPTDGSLNASEIDAEVSARVAAGDSIYTLDDAAQTLSRSTQAGSTRSSTASARSEPPLGPVRERTL